MCKLCERDKDLPLGSFCKNIADDRLAVLERDHAAMERLRNSNIRVQSRYVDLPRRKEYTAIDSLNRKDAFANDPADAILGVSDKEVSR